MMQLHQDAELRHGESRGFGEVIPAVHRTVHEYIHPFAGDLGELDFVSHS